MNRSQGRIIGLFTLDLRREFRGHVLIKGELGPISLTLDGAEVRVRPEVGKLSGRDILGSAVPAGLRPEWLDERLPFLVQLHVEVERPTSDLDYLLLTKVDIAAQARSFDEIHAGLLSDYGRFRLPADEAAQRTLLHVRAKLGDPSIHVDTAHMKSRFLREDGTLLFDGQWNDFLWDNRGGPLLRTHHALDHEAWTTITRAVAHNLRTDLASDLVLDAELALDNHRYGLALLQAAISAELLTERLVKHELQSRRAISTKAANAFAQDLSKRQLPVLLLYCGRIGQEVKEQLVEIFELRNQLVHGKRRKPVARKEALSAICVARRLLKLERGSGEPGPAASVEAGEAEPASRLGDLRGLGKEIWQGEDAQEYINRLREEWDR